MGLIKRNNYIIKQSNGILWNFVYYNNKGIAYRILKENKWSNFQVVIEECCDNFSVMLLHNDNIHIIYEDLIGNLKLNKYNGAEWSNYDIIANNKNDKFDVYINTVYNNNKTYLFYRILNKENNISKIFYQTLDDKLILSKPYLIDTIKFNHNIPFIIEISNKDLLIMYQQFKDNHQLGYKILNISGGDFSKFNIVDESKYPYIDYSVLYIKNSIHSIGIKKDNDDEKLIYYKENNSNIDKKIMFENINIQSCSAFKKEEFICLAWIHNNKLYNCISKYSDNNLSEISYIPIASSTKIIKSKFISHLSLKIKNTLLSEIYTIENHNLKTVQFFNIFKFQNKEKLFQNTLGKKQVENLLRNKKNNTNNKKVHQFKKMLKEKEQLISKLKQTLNEDEIKLLAYESKIESINEEFNSFQKNKDLLKENIVSIEENLMYKEEMINELKKIDENKENEILNLKNKVTEKQNYILSLVKEKDKLKKQIDYLNYELDEKSLTTKNSFLKKLFNNRKEQN